MFGIFLVCLTGTLLPIKHYAFGLTITHQRVHCVITTKAPAAMNKSLLSILDHPFDLFSPLTVSFFFLINSFIFGCIGSSLLRAGFL